MNTLHTPRSVSTQAMMPFEAEVVVATSWERAGNPMYASTPMAGAQ